MPLYDYQCQACRKVVEVRHGFNAAYDEPCPHCGGKLGRVFNPAGIVFKGSGFYVTDSRKASSGDGAPAPAKPAEAPKAADAKKSDAA